MTVKIKWTVAPEETGRYRSFFKRGWPTATIGGEHAFAIECDDAYTPARARGEQSHGPLKLLIADRRDAYTNGKGAWTVRRLKTEFKTLEDVKAAAEMVLAKHSEFFVIKEAPGK